jgi:uncharacterized delta-60 repeat protein
MMMMVMGSWLVKVKAAAGDLDPTFSNDGRQTTTFAVNDYAEAVAIQSDGRIVVAGYTGPAGNYDFGVSRYNSNGTLDVSFSGDGKLTTDFFGENDFGEAVAIQSDGKIIVAGVAVSEQAGNEFALVRYNTDGTLDNTFDGDGRVTTDFNGDDDVAYDILIQPNGKIVVGGSTKSNGMGNDFALARYNTNGTLDATFSGDGKQSTDFGGSDTAAAIAIQSNGKVVAAGYSSAGGYFAFALARYNTNGALDTTFSGDGKTTTNLGDDASSAYSVAIQSNGRIVAGGSVVTGIGTTNFALARYNGNGSLDTGGVGDSTPNDEFGTGGLLITDFFNGYDSAINDVAIQSDDKIVAVGYADHPVRDFAVARYEPNGALDNTFSGDGKLTTTFVFNRYDEARAVAIQADGNIVVAGTNRTITPGYNFALARYLGD